MAASPKARLIRESEEAVAHYHPTAIPRCPKCSSDFLLRSSTHSAFETFLFVFGGELLRCTRCKFRYASFKQLSIPLNPPPAKKHAFRDVAILISSGVLMWMAIALLMLHRFRRWPF
jgi:hypothetical protein